MSNGNSGPQFTGGNTQPINHRLRAPQNGSQMQGNNSSAPRYNNNNSSNSNVNQQQQNGRPMSQRLGPSNAPNSTPHHNNNNKSSTSYVKVLEDYFNQMGLGTPEFKTSKLEKKTSNAGGKSSKKGGVTSTKFYSTVRVNNQSFQVSVLLLK